MKHLVRLFGLQRSGNHAVISWISGQYKNRTLAHCNNVTHLPKDPVQHCQEVIMKGDAAEGWRVHGHDIVLLSFEDDRYFSAGRDLADTMCDPELREFHLHEFGSERAVHDFVIVRDPLNFLASRVKKLEELSGEHDLAKIIASYKAIIGKVSEGRIEMISYNEWFANKEYRLRLSQRLGGRFNDETMKRVAYQGGGSSFDAQEYGRLGIGDFLRNYRKLGSLSYMRQLPQYLRRLSAKGGDQMAVLERWHHMDGHAKFRTVLEDQELLTIAQEQFALDVNSRAAAAG